jgi:hypothetical protein
MTAWVYARSALLRAGLRRKEWSLFCIFTARLKPCPDTCMADGCSGAVQAGLCALRVAAREPAAQGRGVILRLYGTAKAVP